VRISGNTHILTHTLQDLLCVHDILRAVDDELVITARHCRLWVFYDELVIVAECEGELTKLPKRTHAHLEDSR
jgi:hypothetical protein